MKKKFLLPTLLITLLTSCGVEYQSATETSEIKEDNLEVVYDFDTSEQTDINLSISHTRTSAEVLSLDLTTKTEDQTFGLSDLKRVRYETAEHVAEEQAKYAQKCDIYLEPLTTWAEVEDYVYNQYSISFSGLRQVNIADMGDDGANYGTLLTSTVDGKNEDGSPNWYGQYYYSGDTYKFFNKADYYPTATYKEVFADTIKYGNLITANNSGCIFISYIDNVKIKKDDSYLYVEYDQVQVTWDTQNNRTLNFLFIEDPQIVETPLYSCICDGVAKYAVCTWTQNPDTLYKYKAVIAPRDKLEWISVVVLDIDRTTISYKYSLDRFSYNITGR